MSKFKNLILSPAFWAVAVTVTLVVPNIALAFTEYNSLLAKMANIFLPLGAYLFVMSLWRRTGALIWCLFLVFVLCAFQIVLLYLYGEGIIAIDMFMNLVTTNTSEASELLGNLKIALITVFILYLPPLVCGAVMWVRGSLAPAALLRRMRIAGCAVGAVGAALALLAALVVPGYRPEREIFPLNVTYNLVTAVKRYHEAMHYHQSSAEFSYQVTPTRKPSEKEVYVLLIGETSRADNWQLFGYNRPTTPRLAKNKAVTGFGRTLSEINTTHKSVPMLLSFLTSKTFGDSVAHTRSIFSAFNDCGYQTVFISNQRRNHSYIDFYGEEARTAHFLTDDAAGPAYDMELVAEMQKAIAQSASNKIFFILHAYGSHFEYRKRYPQQMAHFTPETNSEASALNRRQLLNAYDNTILYTDLLVDSVINTLAKMNVRAGMLYVSDHGEDIFDDRRERFLHSSPVPTYWQLHVPMLVWMSDSLRAEHPEMYAAARTNRDKRVSSSRSTFHTLLQMSGIQTPYYDPSASVLSASYSEPAASYLNDYNESVPLSRSGVRKPDQAPLRKIMKNPKFTINQ